MYQALYRKYRPQTFSDVVGQKSITETLRSQIVSGKFSHAYLFTGSRGTGKTSCAKILAKAVNCLDPQDGNPCNHCAACMAIDSGSCMDVLEIDAASNNGVDHARALRDDAIYSPSEVKRRVYIIDEVHMLSNSAFNALLKIIEEPPEHLMFILATTELHKVPATILSRCQRFSFRRLSAEDIASRINYVAYQENIEIEPEACALLARLADGALRDGLSLLDQCASATTDTVTEQLVCTALGLAGDRKTVQLLTAIAEQDTAAALELFSSLYASGKDLAALLDELCSLIRDLLMLKTAPKSGLSMLSGVAGDQETAALCKRFSAEELLRHIRLLQQTLAGFSRSVNRRVDTELCLVQMCRPALSADTDALLARIGRLEEKLSSGHFVQDFRASLVPPLPTEETEPEPEEEKPAQPAAENVPPQNDDAFWPELEEMMAEAVSVKCRGYFQPNGMIMGRRMGDTLLLVCDSQFIIDLINESCLDIVREKAQNYFKRPIQIKLCKKGMEGAAGEDPMKGLISFGKEHQDVFQIK